MCLVQREDKAVNQDQSLSSRWGDGMVVLRMLVYGLRQTWLMTKMCHRISSRQRDLWLVVVKQGSGTSRVDGGELLQLLCPALFDSELTGIEDLSCKVPLRLISGYNSRALPRLGTSRLNA